MQQIRQIVEAATRLLGKNGSPFTTQELVKEAGIAIQTFYRHFSGKDQLLLAVIEDVVSGEVPRYEAAAKDMTDPLARLRRHVTSALSTLGGDELELSAARHVAAEHWRLHQLYPAELEQADRAFADLVGREIAAAQEAGLIAPLDTDRMAGLINLLVRSVFHHYAFMPHQETAEDIAATVWKFCLYGIAGVEPGRTGNERPDRPSDLQ